MSAQHVITGYTRLIGLLGKPIKHSKSPRMQNLAFAEIGVDCVYLTFDVDDSNLKEAIQAMRTLDVVGFNVTMPNKQTVIPFLDELSVEAMLIGSVNCVSNLDGVLKGYNTDGMGFVKNLDDHHVDYRGKKVVQSGAGGAGRAVAVQMALSGVAELSIFDVDEVAARTLCDTINQNIATCRATPHKQDETALIAEMRTAAIYADTTPLGMAPLEDKSAVTSADRFPEGIVVVDIVHTPPETKLLRLAASRGLECVNGIGMMFNQGAMGFKIWTGKDMPLEYVQTEMNLAT